MAFKGLFIGGPEEGEFLYHDNPIYKAVETGMPEQFSYKEGAFGGDSIEYREHLYRYFPITTFKDGEIIEAGIWVHESIESPLDYLIEHFAQFVKKTKPHR